LCREGTTSSEIIFLSKASVIEFYCGSEFTLFLTANNELYAGGSNKQGQLGVGSNISHTHKPHRVNLRQKGEITHFKAGHQHSIVVLDHQYIFVSGENGLGQLGAYSKESNFYTFTAIRIYGYQPEKDPIVQVETKGNHTILLSESGRAFGCGANKHDALALGFSNPFEFQFREINTIGEAITKVFVGKNSTLFLTQFGTIFCAGKNEHNALWGKRESNNGPYRFNGLPNMRPLVDAALGPDFSIFIGDGK
jgi:alpha-tubulin suppressor-like RCC1 family protein